MKKVSALLVSISTLSGCVTPEERRAANLEADRQSCTAYGFPAGSSAFANCMMQLGQQRALADMVYRQNASRMGAQLLNGQPAF